MRVIAIFGFADTPRYWVNYLRGLPPVRAYSVDSGYMNQRELESGGEQT